MASSTVGVVVDEERTARLIDDDTNGATCHNCDKTAIFDLSGRGVEEFFSCEDCFVQRAGVVLAVLSFIHQSNLRVRSSPPTGSPIQAAFRRKA